MCIYIYFFFLKFTNSAVKNFCLKNFHPGTGPLKANFLFLPLVIHALLYCMLLYH